MVNNNSSQGERRSFLRELQYPSVAVAPIIVFGVALQGLLLPHVIAGFGFAFLLACASALFFWRRLRNPATSSLCIESGAYFFTTIAVASIILAIGVQVVLYAANYDDYERRAEAVARQENDSFGAVFDALAACAERRELQRLGADCIGQVRDDSAKRGYAALVDAAVRRRSELIGERYPLPFPASLLNHY